MTPLRDFDYDPIGPDAPITVEDVAEMAEAETEGICNYCGSKLVEYSHHLNHVLIAGLLGLAAVGGGPVNISDLHMTYVVRNNFQKLRYFDLVEKHVHPDGKTRRGWWKVTPRGWDFLDGRIRVPDRVWTYRGERVRYDGKAVLVSEVHEVTQEFEVWVKERRPR